MASDTPPLQFFREQIDPDHECPGSDACPYPPGMYMLVIHDPDQPDEPGAFIANYYVHNIDPHKLTGAVVDFVDKTFLDNAGNEPAMIAFTRGRDLLRAAVEQIAPPPAVSEDIAIFAEENLAAWKGLIDG